MGMFIIGILVLASIASVVFYHQWRWALKQQHLYIKNSPDMLVEHEWGGNKVEGKQNGGMQPIEIRDESGQQFTAIVYFRSPDSDFNQAFATITSNADGVVRISTWFGPKAATFGFMFNRRAFGQMRVVRIDRSEEVKLDYVFPPNPFQLILGKLGLM